MTLVTVGLAFHNEERFLADAVRSVLSQTWTDLELLLVDDGSTDRSLDIAHSFSDPRVRVVSDGCRRRLGPRLNQVAHAARGSWIARMDADDISHPERLTRQMSLAESADYDVVGTWAAIVDEEGAPIGAVESAPLPPTPRQTLVGGIVPHATMIARRAWFQAHPYDESFRRAEDRDLWIRTLRSSFGVVPECLYVVRIHARDRDFAHDYATAQRENRRLFWKHGPSIVGLSETLRLVTVSRAKQGLMSVSGALGLAPQVTRRRGRPLRAHELLMVEEAWRATHTR